jgi:hypothetical protein
MGVAYLAQAARALMPGGNPPDAMAAMQKGPAALRRALQIQPDHARALAQLGGVQALMGSFMQAPARAERGVAQMNRAGDYVRIMRGDLYFETGKPDLARTLYQAVEKSGSRAAVDAKARLAALEQGGVAMSDIKALRAAAGAQCAMCHGG